MAKIDWLVVLGSAALVVIPASVRSEGLTKGDRAVFAIKPVGTCGDVKTRLWRRVLVVLPLEDGDWRNHLLDWRNR